MLWLSVARLGSGEPSVVPVGVFGTRAEKRPECRRLGAQQETIGSHGSEPEQTFAIENRHYEVGGHVQRLVYEVCAESVS